MKILITESDNFSPKAMEALQEKFDVTAANVQTRDQLLAQVAGFDALFVRLGLKIDREVLDKATNLKYILTATTGLDHIDREYFESAGGTIISLLGETDFLGTIPSTAEHSWALLLALVKKIPTSFSHVREGSWNRNLFIGNNLNGKKIGILGLGRVGKQVARFAGAFEMEVGFYDISPIQSDYKQLESATELFQWADIISIHIPFNPQNSNFVNASLLEICDQTIMINTSRGGIWDENAVANAIKSGKLSGVATDVLADEFDEKLMAKNPLVRLANNNFNVIITPHIAGATVESMRVTEDFIAAKFLNSNFQQ